MANTKEIRVLISAAVTGQAMSGTWLGAVWENGQNCRSVVRLDTPVRCGDGVMDYIVVLNRDCSFTGHH